MKSLALALITGLGATSPALASDWLQAPEPEAEYSETDLDDAMPQTMASGPAGQCIGAILAAEARYDIPGHLLLALGLQEAGWQSPSGLTIWPWSVNAAGDGRRFSTRSEAQAFVQRKLSEGVESIDVGCLQINLRWHPDAFATLSQGFDPLRNVDYAARFLRELYEESGDWWQAAGRYHSRSAGPQATYLAGLSRNQKVVNARLNHFYALAEGAGAGADGMGMAQDFDYVDLPPNYRTEGAIWGAAIAGEEGARRTLYSADDLQPVLPNFLPPEA